jgi:predicted O-methyltransferase YrrM
MSGTKPATPQLPGYEFTSDWFSGNIPAWLKIIDFKPKNVLEIGCYEGRATTWLIDHCQPREVEVHCVDPWVDYADLPKQKMAEIEDRFDKNIAVARQNNPLAKAIKHKKLSSQALAEFISERKHKYFDVIYIDGSHHATDVLSDAVMSFPLLRIGGIMIFDDYLWRGGSEGNDPLCAPKAGIDAFLNVFHSKMRILPFFPLWQIYARKLSE